MTRSDFLHSQPDSAEIQSAVERSRQREAVDHAEEAELAEKEEEIQLWQDRFRLFIESVDTVIYLAIAVVFILGAAAMLGYSAYAFVDGVKSGFASAIVSMINDLLLVMIMMEVLKTILSYLEDHAISLRPFLFVGVISAT